MNLILIINEKIDESRKALSRLMNQYLQDEITRVQFWEAHKLLDERTTVQGRLQIINPDRLFKDTGLKQPGNHSKEEFQHSVLQPDPS